MTGSNVVWRGRLKELDREDAQNKTWWDSVKNDMEHLGLSQKGALFKNKWRKRIKGQPANPDSPGKMAVKTECLCAVIAVPPVKKQSVSNLIGIRTSQWWGAYISITVIANMRYIARHLNAG